MITRTRTIAMTIPATGTQRGLPAGGASRPGPAPGSLSVTMSQIAEETGIGRATLYKYFPDVESILIAWHERQIAGHLSHLAEIRDQESDDSRRLEAVLEAYALIRYEHHGTELAAFLHRGEHIARAEQHLRDFLQDLLAESAKTGSVRTDVALGELA